MGARIPSVMVDLSNILFNASLAYIIWKISKVKTISYKLMFSLSLSDIAVGLSGLVYHSVLLSSYPSNAATTVEIKNIFTFVSSFTTLSARFVMSIAIDRFIHMKYLNRYHLVMTKRKASILVGINFGILSIEISTIAFPAIRFCYYAIAMPLHAVGTAIIIILYFWAFISVKARVDELNINQRRVRSVDKHFGKGVLLIVIVVFLCYSPVLAVLICRYNLGIQIPDSLMSWAAFSVLLNSTLNAAILALFNREIKSYIVQLLCC